MPTVLPLPRAACCSRPVFAPKTLSLSLFALFSGGALAQNLPPDAGQVLRESPGREMSVPQAIPAVPLSGQPAAEAPAAASSARFVLKQVRLSGNRAIDTATLEALVRDAYGQQTDLAGVQQLAQRLTAHYRQQGYLLARAYLPAQTIRDGIVDIHLLEGFIEKKALNNRSGVDSGLIESVLAAVPDGEPARSDELDRALLILAEQPGLSGMKVNLRPGQAAGGSELAVDADAAPRVMGRLYADNHGNRYTGQNRLGAQVAVNNLIGRADQLNLSLTGTDEKTLMGRASWDALLAGNGLRGGFAFSSSRYLLGQEYGNLNAHGTVNAVSLYGSYPLVRRPEHWVTLGGSLEHRWLKDHIDSVSSVSEKAIDALALNASGRHTDAWGGNAWSAALTAGNLNLNTATVKATDQVAARTAGHYLKLSALFMRDQRLIGSTFLRGQVQGQWADKNLDSSEKFSLGGVYGVRAYPQGEAIGDQGWLARLDLRHALNSQWQIGAGYDAGQVRVNTNPYLTTANNVRRSGVALFAEGVFGNFDLSATVAWRTLDIRSVSAPDKSPRLWLQAGWRF